MKKFFFILAVTVLLWNVALFAGEQDIPNLKLLTNSNCAGTEFYLTIPPARVAVAQPTDYVGLFIYSDYEAEVDVEIPSQGFFKKKILEPFETTLFKLSIFDAQCYIVGGERIPDAVYKGRGVRISSDYPVIVHCVVVYNLSADGFLVYPVEALGTEYIASSYDEKGYNNSQFPGSIGIVAAHDNTSVKFTMGGNDGSKTTGGLTPGGTVSEMLDKGDVWLFSTGKKYSDLSGSKVESSKPVAVISGNHCANVPTSNPNCDYTVEMDMPTHSWGKTYFVCTGPSEMDDPPVVRVFAKESLTKIYRNGAQIGVVNKPGGVIGDGFLEFLLTSPTEPRKPAAISGDKPIAVTMFNPGIKQWQWFTKTQPYETAMIPLGHFIKEITFTTPAVQDDSDFDNHFIELVYEAGTAGALPDHYEIGQFKNEAFEWQKINEKYTGPGNPVDYEINGKRYGVKLMQITEIGLYKIRANTPFCVYSFGAYSEGAYGYQAASPLYALDVEDTEPPAFQYSKGNGGIFDGMVEDMPKSGAKSNLRHIYLLKNESTNFQFSHDDFIPGRDKSTTWEAEPIDNSKSAEAYIVAMDRAGNDSIIYIKYIADELKTTLDEYDFGIIKRGKSVMPELPVEIENTSELFDFQVEDIIIAQSGPFSISFEKTPPFEIKMGETITGKVVFNTDSPNGEYFDTLLINAGFGLKNKGIIKAVIAEPEISVGSADFGDIGYGEEYSKSFRIENTKPMVDLEIFAVEKAESGMFSYDYKTPTKDKPMILGGAESFKDIRAVIKPNARGEFRDTLVFSSDAGKGMKNDSIAIISATAFAAEIETADVIFGFSEIGKTEKKNMVIKNTGDWDLKITKIYFPSGGEFSFNPGMEISGQNPLVIGQGASHNIEVEFTRGPNTPDKMESELNIVSNAINGELAAYVKYDSEFTGISDIIESESIRLYPNPAKALLSISFNSRKAMKISAMIYDSQGAAVKQSVRSIDIAPGGNTIEFDLSGLPQGAYLLSLESAGGALVEKFNIIR